MKSISSIELKAKIIKNYLIKLASMPAPVDSFFKNVTLLLHGNGDNGQQNNTVLDSSANNFPVTRNGNVAQGTFSPYGNNWSNYFDGTGDYLTAPANSAYDFGTGNFTMECWFLRQKPKAQLYHDNIFGNRATVFPGGVWHMYVGPNENDPFGFQISVAGTGWTISGGSCENGKWNHIAIVRNGNTFTLYVNGFSVATGTNTASVGNATNVISVGAFTDGAYPCIGYVSNLRIVKGTALYTSDFVPSETPLTAIANTSLLTCQSNRFRDASANNFTITRNGNSSVERFSPFSPITAYNLSIIGGSAYFDGIGDNLRITSSNLNIGTDQFTVEAWVYPTTSSAWRGIYGFGPSAGDVLYVGPSNNLVMQFDGSGGTTIQGGSVPFSAWTHIAVTRDASNVLRIFTNGVLASSTTSTYNINSNSPLIGGRAADGLEPYPGYISNLRVIKGTALYTTSFAVPTSPVTAISNTQLLLNFVNGGIIDNSMISNAETVGHPNISTSVKKFGSGSIYFDGVGDYLKIRGTKDFDLLSEDFTIELWFNCSSFSGSTRTILSKDGVLNSTNAQYSIFIDSTGKVNATVGSGDSTVYTQSIVSGTTISTGVWYHLAFVRNGTTLRLFLNGIQEASATQTGVMTTGNKNLIIGWEQDQYTSYYFDGYIDDLRITKGIARYTAGFIMPKQQFPDI